MQYTTKFIYQSQYKWVSSNQHGDRYEKKSIKQIRVARLSASPSDADDLTKLILLSDRLQVPIYYDFDSDPQCAYIEVVSTETLRDNTS